MNYKYKCESIKELNPFWHISRIERGTKCKKSVTFDISRSQSTIIFLICLIIRESLVVFQNQIFFSSKIAYSSFARYGSIFLLLLIISRGKPSFLTILHCSIFFPTNKHRRQAKEKHIKQVYIYTLSEKMTKLTKKDSIDFWMY